MVTAVKNTCSRWKMDKYEFEDYRASLLAQTIACLQCRRPGQEDPLEKGMATHSSILTWKIPWTEEPGGLQSMVYKESDMTE